MRHGDSVTKPDYYYYYLLLIDYCNSVLNRACAVHLRPLQSVLRFAAPLILRIRKYDRISAAIREELHWLPVHYMIRFKTCALVHKCLHGIAPSYLIEMTGLVAKGPSRRRHPRFAAHGDDRRVAYLGFYKEGGCSLPTSAHTKRWGANRVFQFFSTMSNKFFSAKRGHGRFGQGVNTPLRRSSCPMQHLKQKHLVREHLPFLGQIAGTIFMLPFVILHCPSTNSV